MLRRERDNISFRLSSVRFSTKFSAAHAVRNFGSSILEGWGDALLLADFSEADARVELNPA